ncbi:hypothetical protein NUBL10709_37250 [Klebsiella pneumoniae]|nr:hypothetical protein NUBL10709_37250 [Klebsiella pneumoniae]
MAEIPGLRLTPYSGYKLSWVSNFWGAVQQRRRALRPQFTLTFLPGGGFALPGLGAGTRVARVRRLASHPGTLLSFSRGWR